MPVDKQTFFDIMASFPSGVAIVTTLDEDGTPRGLTSTAVSSVSVEPPLMLVCADLASRTLSAIRRTGAFVVNFMREGRDDLCLLFASKEEDKFAGISWAFSPRGLPLLHEDAVAWAECRTVREIEAGDHFVLLGEVEAGQGASDTDAPLMYYRRSWGVWRPAAARGAPRPVAPTDVGARDLRWEGAEL